MNNLSSTVKFQAGRGLTISVSVALFILLGLGTWQALKVGPKSRMIAAIETGLEAPPVDLFQAIAADGVPTDYQRVRFSGRFLHAEPMPVFGTNLSGRSGYQLYGVMDVPQVGQVLASAGWIGFDQQVPKLAGTMRQVSGLILPAPVPGPFTPANQPAENIWYWADIDSMAALQGSASSLSQRIILDDMDPDDGIMGGQARIDIPNNHFEYMLTWYGLAGALLAVYAGFGFSRGRQA